MPDLEQRPLGKTGLNVTVVYGAMLIGEGELRDGASVSLLHTLESGVTCIDTARGYGMSEKIVGQTLRAYKGPPPVIATKVAPLPTGDWRFYVPLENAFTPQSITASAEASLKALGVETIDLLQLHQWYYLWTHRPEWLETFRKLKAAGKIRAFGISAQDHEHDALLQVIDERLVDSVQFVFNAFESRPLTSVLPLARQRGVGVIARCVLDVGGLTGALEPDQLEANPYFAKAPPSAYLARIERLKAAFCADGTSLSELAIRFALTAEGVTTLTLSMPQPRFVDSNLAAARKGSLDQVTFQKIHREHGWFKNFWA